MERKFQKKVKFIIISLFFLNFFSWAQTPSVVQHIRFPVWAEVDAYPGLEVETNQAEDDQDYAYAINRIKEIVPFLLEGMVYGWEFTYTPSDKTRGVEEYFEIRVIENLEKASNPIQYSSVWIEESRFNCWVDYNRTDFQIQNYYLWASIQNPVIQGRGYGSLEKGFDGIKEAAENALKAAIRDYYTKKYKNKPKEIQGKVLIRKIPTIGIDAGRYVINLDFFLECGKIKEYSQF